jgi:hypothetical protein
MNLHHFYVHKEKDVYRHFFQSLAQMKMCGSGEVTLVKVTEDPHGDYYGWLRVDKVEYSLIFKTLLSLEVCFPYGTKAEVEAGNGRVVRLKVEEVKT